MSLLKKIFALPLATTPAGMMYGAQRKGRKEQKHQEHLMFQQSVKAEAAGVRQQKQKAAIQRRISAANIRSSRRRSRGGIFGGSAEIGPQNVSSMLGG